MTTREVTTIEPRLTQILEILVSNRGQVVSRDSIIEVIWGNYASGPELLTHSISMIRKTIGHDSIITIPKKGYMINPVPLEQANRFDLFGKHLWIMIIVGLAIVRILFSWHH